MERVKCRRMKSMAAKSAFDLDQENEENHIPVLEKKQILDEMSIKPKHSSMLIPGDEIARGMHNKKRYRSQSPPRIDGEYYEVVSPHQKKRKSTIDWA